MDINDGRRLSGAQRLGVTVILGATVGTMLDTALGSEPLAVTFGTVAGVLFGFVITSARRWDESCRR